MLRHAASLIGCAVLLACGGGENATPGPGGELATAADALSSSCAGLVPASTGAARMVSVSGSSDLICLQPTADGASALGVGVFDAVSEDASDQLFTLAGAPAGGFGTHGMGPVQPQASGFQALGSGGAWTWLDAWDHAGHELTQVVLTRAGDQFELATDYGGGSLVAGMIRTGGSSGTPTVTITAQRWSSTGTPRSAAATVWRGAGNGGALVAGVNLSGHSLVLWQATGDGPLLGRWVDRVGSPLSAVFTAATIAEGAGLLGLQPLYDGSLVLRVGPSWSHRFADRATASSPVASWLTSRPGTRIAFIRGGLGYAMWQAADSALACSHQIGIHAQNGATCGSVIVPLPSCAAGDLAIGRDGTVMQETTRACSSGPPCFCDARYFPQLLH